MYLEQLYGLKRIDTFYLSYGVKKMWKTVEIREIGNNKKHNEQYSSRNIKQQKTNCEI